MRSRSFKNPHEFWTHGLFSLADEASKRYHDASLTHRLAINACRGHQPYGAGCMTETLCSCQRQPACRRAPSGPYGTVSLHGRLSPEPETRSTHEGQMLEERKVGEDRAMT
ncbi:cytoskeleton-associated protein 5 [Platysternon megacephalum]|uniref:Cytoskeleton-associated protein 5 n=1 Tax=Platysternon megacephalum TaxID=55544 RepID=A0A4D9EAB1_9SAUR|nr:cytoskeleton-associated protein 5 [Platysternon megacephalum]